MKIFCLTTSTNRTKCCVDSFAFRHSPCYSFEGNALGGRFETIDVIVGSGDSGTASNVTSNSLIFAEARIVRGIWLNLPKHFPAIWPKPFPTTTPSTSQIPIPRWSSPGPGPGHKYYYCTLKASMWQCPCMCSPCIEYTTCNSAYLADRILPRFTKQTWLVMPFVPRCSLTDMEKPWKALFGDGLRKWIEAAGTTNCFIPPEFYYAIVLGLTAWSRFRSKGEGKLRWTHFCGVQEKAVGGMNEWIFCMLAVCF